MKLFFENILEKPWNFFSKVFLCLLFFSFSIGAQNQLQKTIDPGKYNQVRINGNQVFEIEIQTEARKTIELVSIVDGEYGDHFQFDIKLINNVYTISLWQSQLSIIEDDKRNAHKVVAAKMLLKLPEGFIVDVVSDVGNLEIEGNFKTLRASLQTGFCRFKGLVDFLEVETRDGNIHLETKDVNVKARSSKGDVSVSNAIQGNGFATLKSINGDIWVQVLKE